VCPFVFTGAALFGRESKSSPEKWWPSRAHGWPVGRSRCQGTATAGEKTALQQRQCDGITCLDNDPRSCCSRDVAADGELACIGCRTGHDRAARREGPDVRQPTHVLCSRGQEFNRLSKFNGGANGTWTEYREVAAGSDVFCPRQTIRRDLAGPGTSVQGQLTLLGRSTFGKRGEADLILRCVATAAGKRGASFGNDIVRTWSVFGERTARTARYAKTNTRQVCGSQECI
jgi:hypothetical protein